MTPAQLDTILALQLTVAWAGEKAADPPRLAWWDTDLTDEAAGGDLFARLLPKTAAWAGLEMARRAAIQQDASERARLSDPDRALTLFHFGFEIDEALRDRLEHHKRHGVAPPDVFTDAWAVRPAWNRDEFSTFLDTFQAPKTETAPTGRELKSVAADPVEAAKSLAAALLPLTKTYPLPFAPMPSRG